MLKLDEDLEEVNRRLRIATQIFKQRPESYKPSEQTTIDDTTANIILSLFKGLIESVQERRNKNA